MEYKKIYGISVIAGAALYLFGNDVVKEVGALPAVAVGESLMSNAQHELRRNGGGLMAYGAGQVLREHPAATGLVLIDPLIATGVAAAIGKIRKRAPQPKPHP